MREGRDQAIEGEPCSDFGVAIDEGVVVVIDELKPQRLSEDRPDEAGEEKADRGESPFWVPRDARRRRGCLDVGPVQKSTGDVLSASGLGAATAGSFVLGKAV